MKSKMASAPPSAKDAKYAELIQEYLMRIDEIRGDLRRSKAEIDRLKAASKRKLGAIDAVLNAC